jgi:NAD(P) transhydrogenase subunit beta
MISLSLLEISYILASIFFILGLKMLSNPETARRGNIIAATGMSLAILFTILFHKKDGMPVGNLGLILIAIGIGGILGFTIAKKVKMTSMPQLVSLFNGMGGACAALIALLEFPKLAINSEPIQLFSGVVFDILLGLVIGSVSFAGSLIAFGKLSGKVGDIRSKTLSYINMIFLLLIIVFMGYIMSRGTVVPITVMPLVIALLVLSLAYGVLFVMPIGGADMPVVISLLNSFTGIAAATGGFLYNNQAMLTGGILVGSAGAILTVLMCKAMNRSLLNVVIGAFGGHKGPGIEIKGNIKEITLSDASILLSYSQKVVIVPGYGLAIAQAQHLCHELEKLLEEKNVEVLYAIHPVAGRMPGHMNVLLAEADVSYNKLIEMDDINPTMPDVDVCLIIGANDVVNPAAIEDPSSPIYGMPIIKAYEAKNIIVMKRGMGKGYAAIENNLFYNDKTRMLFGDAKETLQKLITEIKNLN